MEKNQTVRQAPVLRSSQVWRTEYRNTAIKIVSWTHTDPSGYFAERYPSGNWNYYIYIFEDRCPRFTEIWLEPETYQITPTTPMRVSYDYYSSPLGSVLMHGGITYYQKYGEIVGNRSVEIGCDYAHLHDDGQHYNESVCLRDAMETVDDLYEKGLLVTKEGL